MGKVTPVRGDDYDGRFVLPHEAMFPSGMGSVANFGRPCGLRNDLGPVHQAAKRTSIRFQTSTRAPVNSRIISSVCAGPGVKRSRSVPRGTVGKLIG